MKITDRKITPWIHLAFWLLLGVVNLVLSNWFLDPQMNVWRPLINHAVMALMFYANAWLVNRYLEKKAYVPYFAWTNLMIWALVPVRFFINKFFLMPEGPEPPNLAKGLIFGALATGYGIVMLSTIYQLLVNRYAEERKALDSAKRQTEAELQFLRAQINPHFLFNTLNNIYSLAVVRSPKTADMVLKLSQLLRYVVYEHKEKKVPVEREVEHIRHFIELFQMRSEEPLNIKLEVDGDLSEVKIEPMILIPIVENCFKHCDFDTNRNAFVNIQLSVNDGVLTFKTFNSKNDADQQKDQVGGVGLENIRRRLELQHHKAFQFSTKTTKEVFGVFFTLNLSEKA
ncbi:MAG: histidine kinase [Saprospiraceae bacterium]|nr:histidine kinase [Saprospiraceae bacterium]